MFLLQKVLLTLSFAAVPPSWLSEGCVKNIWSDDKEEIDQSGVNKVTRSGESLTDIIFYVDWDQ